MGKYERPQQQQGQQHEQQQARRSEAESFAEFLRDPWGWVERELRRQQAAQAAQQRRGGGSERSDGYGFYEQARRQQQEWQRQQQEQQQWQRQWQQRTRGAGGRSDSGGAAAGPRDDPKGFYRRLGVSPSASQEQVSEAFRALVSTVPSALVMRRPRASTCCSSGWTHARA